LSPVRNTWANGQSGWEAPPAMDRRCPNDPAQHGQPDGQPQFQIAHWATHGQPDKHSSN